MRQIKTKNLFPVRYSVDFKSNFRLKKTILPLDSDFTDFLKANQQKINAEICELDSLFKDSFCIIQYDS